MDYPLDLKLPDPAVGFAVANDEAEHQVLTDAGYEPALVVSDADPSESDAVGHTVESVRATLDAAGITYSKRLGLAKLINLLPSAG